MPLRHALPIAGAAPVTDPLAALRALASRPYPFLLHSALEGARARWSFFGAEPFAIHRGGDHARAIGGFRTLAERARVTDALASLVPFTGGAVGYWAYDFGRRLERLRLPGHGRGAADDLGLPDFVLSFYDVVGAYDHGTREAWLFSSGLPLEGERRA